MNDKIKILYIDDYDLDRELVRDALEREHGGFELTEASDKPSFERLLKTQGFDVVLSDFNIAGYEGLQVLQAVRAHYPEKETAPGICPGRTAHRFRKNFVCG